jgi:integrase
VILVKLIYFPDVNPVPNQSEFILSEMKCGQRKSSVFRYSYANVAKQLGYSKDLIAEALGHEYGNSVTGIYLEQFDNEVVDKMNQELIKCIIY